MTTIDTASQTASHSASTSGGAAGIMSTVGEWLTSTDHKKIGRLLIGSGLVGLLGVAVVGGLLSAERANVNSVFLGNGPIVQLFAIDRVGLAFLALLPIMLGLGVAIVPLQLGARSLAFPRLASAGFWAWFFGAALIIVSIACNGGPGGGASKYVALFITSFGVMLAGLTAIAISLATSVLTTRAPGMNMRRVPLFAWSVLISALGLILALPVAIGATVYLYVSYRYNRVPFGGNYGIFDWLGFSLTQPLTFLYALPALGFAAEMFPTAARKRMPMRQTVLAGLALVGVAAFAGVTQVQHTLPWRGSNLYLGHLGKKINDLIQYGFFNGLPVLGAVIVLLLGPLAFRSARPKITAPFVFGFFGMGMILVGMLGNLVYGVDDLKLSGTVFEEGAYTYVCYGAILAALGAVTYWGPKLTGRKIADKQVLPLALLGVLGVMMASFPYYIAGFADQPANAVTFIYSGPQALWNWLATIGHGLFLLTVVAFIGLAVKSFRGGEAAGDDPWDGQTLEWATSSPAPENNFAEMHAVMSPEPLLDLKPSGENA